MQYLISINAEVRQRKCTVLMDFIRDIQSHLERGHSYGPAERAGTVDFKESSHRLHQITIPESLDSCILSILPYLQTAACNYLQTTIDSVKNK